MKYQTLDLKTQTDKSKFIPSFAWSKEGSRKDQPRASVAVVLSKNPLGRPLEFLSVSSSFLFGLLQVQKHHLRNGQIKPAITSTAVLNLQKCDREAETERLENFRGSQSIFT